MVGRDFDALVVIRVTFQFVQLLELRVTDVIYLAVDGMLTRQANRRISVETVHRVDGFGNEFGDEFGIAQIVKITLAAFQGAVDKNPVPGVDHRHA